MLYGNALTALATLHLDGGDHGRAARSARHALRIHAGTGRRLGQAGALYVLSQILDREDAADDAARCAAQARAIFTALGAPEGGQIYSPPGP